MSDYTLEVTDLSPVSKQVQITLPESAFRVRVENLLTEIAKTAEIKGFRAGKAPRKLIDSMYHSRAVREVQSALIEECLTEVIQQRQIEPLVPPSLKLPDYQGEGDWVATMSLEVRPVIESVKVEGVEVEREKVEVTDEDVEKAIDWRRQNRATMRTVEGRTMTEKGDWLRMDYQPFLDGASLEDKMSNEEISLEDESGFRSEFTQNLLGREVGTDFEFSVKIPEDFREARLRGKDILYRCRINEICGRDLPALDDEFARDEGNFESVAQFRDHVRAELAKVRESNAERRLSQAIWDALVKANPLTLPPVRLERHVEDLLKEKREELVRRGIANPDESLLRSMVQKEAEFGMHLAYLQNTLFEQYEITVIPEEMEAQYAKVAEQTGSPVEAVRKYFTDPERRFEFEITYKGRKLLEELKKRVTFVDASPKQPSEPAEETV